MLTNQVPLIVKLVSVYPAWYTDQLGDPRRLLWRVGPPPPARPMCSNEGIWVYSPIASPRALRILMWNTVFEHLRPVRLEVLRLPTRGIHNRRVFIPPTSLTECQPLSWSEKRLVQKIHGALRKKKNNSPLVKCAHFEFHCGKVMMLCTIGSAKMDKRWSSGLVYPR
jgi:hypothetical protein